MLRPAWNINDLNYTPLHQQPVTWAFPSKVPQGFAGTRQGGDSLRKTHCKGWGPELGQTIHRSANSANALGGDPGKSGICVPEAVPSHFETVLCLDRTELGECKTPAPAPKGTGPLAQVGIAAKGNASGFLPQSLGPGFSISAGWPPALQTHVPRTESCPCKTHVEALTPAPRHVTAFGAGTIQGVVQLK